MTTTAADRIDLERRSLFRVPNRVTDQWIAKTVNWIASRKCETPGTVTDVEARGGWKKSDAGYAAKSREYVVTITVPDGRSCRKIVEVTRGGGVHRFHLQWGTIF
jgi:hypothetical protein